MNYNRLQQGKKRCAGKLRYQYNTTKDKYKSIVEKRGEHFNKHADYVKDGYYPNKSCRALGPRRTWPWRKFHCFKSVPYKNALEEIEYDEE